MNGINSNILMYTQSKYRCIAFSLDPNLVVNGYKKGFDVLYGDGSQPTVLTSAGIDSTKVKAFIVTHTDTDLCLRTVKKLRLAYPDTPLVCRARQFTYIDKLYAAGATIVITDEKETSAALSEAAFKMLGIDSMAVEQIFKKVDDNSFLPRQFFPDDLGDSNSTSQYVEFPPDDFVNDLKDEKEVLIAEADGSTICNLPNR